MSKQNILIVSGYSGSGKTHVLKFLESMYYNCIDNLPIDLVVPFFSLQRKTKNLRENVNTAICVDMRSTLSFVDISDILKKMKQNNYDIKVLFLTADKEVLLQRFQETRLMHPLSSFKKKPFAAAAASSLEELIDLEISHMAPFRTNSDYVIDTSKTNIHDLRRQLEVILGENKNKERQKMILRVVSFGFSKGLPKDVDLVFDLRFLPNPYFKEELKNMTGRDKQVRDYILSHDIAVKFWDKLTGMIDLLIPEYIREGKSYLSIAFGCTGGRHRSVSFAIMISEMLKIKKYDCFLEHRDS